MPTIASDRRAPHSHDTRARFPHATRVRRKAAADRCRRKAADGSRDRRRRVPVRWATAIAAAMPRRRVAIGKTSTRLQTSRLSKTTPMIKWMTQSGRVVKLRTSTTMFQIMIITTKKNLLRENPRSRLTLDARERKRNLHERRHQTVGQAPAGAEQAHREPVVLEVATVLLRRQTRQVEEMEMTPHCLLPPPLHLRRAPRNKAMMSRKQQGRENYCPR